MVSNHKNYTATPHRPKTVVVEGNIGAGKSTFLKMLKNHLDVHVVFEPHTKWQNVNNSGNLLEKFYNDTPRWAYTFQSYVFVTRIMEQEEHARRYAHPVHILERSVFSDRYCFAKNCFEMGLMSALEWQLYQEWFAWLVDQYTSKPDGFVYLRTDPDVCYARLLKRARHEEGAVPKDYLSMLHQKHEDWLVAKKDVAPYIKETPVLILSCDNDFEDNVQEQQRHSDAVLHFINTLPSQQRTKDTELSLSL